MTLEEFIRARFADDETLIREAEKASSSRRWYVRADGVRAGEGELLNLVAKGFWSQSITWIGGLCDGRHSHPIADHIARWDPHGAWEELSLKRHYLADILDTPHHIDPDDPYRPAGAQTCPYEGVCWCGREQHVELRLRRIAKMYADHPDYQEKWQP